MYDVGSCSLRYLKPNSTVHCKRKDYLCSVLTYSTCVYFREITSVLVLHHIKFLLTTTVT